MPKCLAVMMMTLTSVPERNYRRTRHFQSRPAWKHGLKQKEDVSETLCPSSDIAELGRMAQQSPDPNKFLDMLRTDRISEPAVQHISV